MKKLIFTLLCLSLAGSSYAATIIVDVNGDGHFETIQAAIDAANQGDIIEVWPGTYTGPGNRDIDPNGKNLTIRSTDPNDPNIVASTIINPDQQGSGFIFTNGEGPGCVVSGLTVTNGYNGCRGGGFHLSSASPTIKNCVITGNRSLSGSKCPGGGGIHLFSSNAAIINCTISQNTNTWCGGGIYCKQSNPKIVNCFISRNKSPQLSFGGGIYCDSSSPEIVNCTITGNYARYRGGGIYCDFQSSPIITNSILWGNALFHPYRGVEIALNNSSTVTVSYSNIRGGRQWAYIGPGSALNWGNGNIDARPYLTYDGHLQSDSPCIDAGDPCYSPTPTETDIDAEPRLFGDYIDMGADEFIDTDSDSLPDFWEQKYFGSPTASEPNSLPASDPDQDGYTNLEEYVLYATDPTIANGTTYYVDANRPDDSGDGLTWPTAKRTIQAAIDATTNPGDRVIIAEGLYTGAGNYNLDPDGRAIVIQSTDPMDPNVVANTIIDPDQQGRGFIFTNGEGPGCIVSGLTVTNGSSYEDYGGGGFYLSSASPTIKNCIITGNWSWSSPKSPPRGGGGIHLFSSDATITNCTINQNTDTRHGGGIFCYNANPTIRDCSITSNSAELFGNGIYCKQSNPKIINCIISRNNPRYPFLGFGGGIYCDSSSPEIANCTITGNYAGNSGGGILCDYQSNPIITNSILWGNGLFRPNPYEGGVEIAINNSSTVTVSYSNIRGGRQWAYVGPGSVLNWGNGNIDARPNLTLDGHLQSDSPCIDVGDPCYSPTPPATDIDEEQRIYAGSVDMGADEFIDTDGDSLPDFWENKYFGSPVATGPNSKSDADPDTDGHTNLEEYQLYSSDPKVAAKTYYVDALEGYDGHDGLSWRGAKRTIQAAIDETTNPGDRVIIAEGLYTGTGNYNLDPDGRAIVIQSTAPNDPNIVAATIIDPDQQGCGFDLRNGEPAGCRISGLTITNGAGWRDGGGFSLSSASPTISNCFISRNISYHGSKMMGGTGINCYLSSNPIIKNCIISGNTASYCGGAIGCLIYCSPIITNCTITGNRAYLGGGGISSLYSNPTITNCILWENSSPDGNEIYSENSQIDITYSDIQGGLTGLGNINLDPCFIEPGHWDGDIWVDGDYHLLPDSPCINAGDPNHIAEPNETDLDGQPRIFLGRVDIGADEFVPSLEVPMHFTPRTLNPKSKGKWIKAHLVLPEGFSVEDVNTNSPARIIEPFTADSNYMDVFINKDDLVKIMAAFDRADFCSNGSTQGNVVVIGRLTNGQYFYGTDTIRIKTNNLEYLAVLTSSWLAADCGAPDWCSGADLNRDSVVDFIDFAFFDGCCLEFIKN